MTKAGSALMEGNAHRLGDNMNTDIIIPATYLETSEASELGRHLLESHDSGFASRLSPGDMLVAGRNFGSGSSREHAALAIKGAGISCVIAGSFARIFFRNAINVGLPIIESPQVVEVTNQGDRLRVDLSAGTVENLAAGMKFTVEPYPEFMQKIIDSGGLIDFLLRE